MKKILVIVFGLMLGFTTVFGQSADVVTDVCDDVQISSINVEWILDETNDVLPVITTDVDDDIID